MNLPTQATKKALITGAEGFTGQYLIAELLRDGYEVHGLVREMPSAAQQQETERAKLHACDLLDAAGVVAVIEQVRPQQVVHLAGISFVASGDAEGIYRTNLLGTRVLLEALAALPEAPRSVLLASSANVYGNASQGVMHESTTPAPANDYAVSKLAMEYMARLYASRLPLIVCRPFNYTGVGQSESFLLPKIVAHARRGAQVIELGNLDVARDFSDVRMVVQVYARLLENPAAVGETFNVCSGVAHTLNEVLALVEGISGHRFEVHVNPALVRQNEVKSLFGSRARLDACLGKLPIYELRETLAWMLRQA